MNYKYLKYKYIHTYTKVAKIQEEMQVITMIDLVKEKNYHAIFEQGVERFR